MTRLLYDGLKGTLGASLTNSATSVTFSAALTHDNGTAVPTLASGNFIPLSILDSSGNLSEIVWLTAYTSGATTGTIARGKEGTSGVSHASGDKFTHAMTANVAGLVGLGSPFVPFWRSGRWYEPQAGTAFANTTGAAGLVVWSAIYVPNDVTVTDVAIEVTTLAASSSVHLGIYADDGYGQPASLLSNFGSVASTSTGVKTISSLSVALSPGIYWLAALAVGGGPTIRGITAAHYSVSMLGHPSAGDTGVYWGWTQSGQSSLPSDGSGATATSIAQARRIQLKV